MARRKGFNQFQPTKKRPAEALPTEAVELTIEGMTHDGRGVGRHNSKVVFVAGAIPGERVKVRVLARKKQYDEGRVEEWLTTSDQRCEPLCPVYDQCGGCQIQHLRYDAQQTFKQGRLDDVIHSFDANVVLEPESILSAGEWQYRHRARLSYRAGHLGFMAKASHQIVDVGSCPVLIPALNSALTASREALMDYLRGAGNAELMFAVGEDGRVALRISQQREIRVEHCQRLRLTLEGTLELHSVTNGDNQWSAETDPLRYPGTEALPLMFAPSDFTQVNPQVNQLMIAQVCQWLAPSSGELLADFFCGLGNFSQPLAKAGANVAAYDLGAEMISTAQRQAVSLGLDIQYFACDLFDSNALALPKDLVKAVLDPPRAGAKALCEILAGCRQLRDIVYVSCDPGSLKRDLQILCGSGFQLKAYRAADMFPQSYHQESLVWLSR